MASKKKSDLNIPLIVTCGVISLLLLFVIVIGTQAWYMSEAEAEYIAQGERYPNMQLAEFRAEHLQHLSAYHWQDKEHTDAAIPIETAMQVVIAKNGKVEFPAATPSSTVVEGITGANVPSGKLPAGLNAQSVTAGLNVYASKGCLACHNTNGSPTTNGLPSIGPTFKNLFGSEVELEGGKKVVANEAYIHESIRDPQAKIVKGYTTVQMPNFGPLITDQDIEDVIQYLKSISDHYKPDASNAATGGK